MPPIFATTLAELLEPKNDADKKPTSNVIGPKFTKDPYDSPDDPCQTIDLPARVFKAVMPRKEDLPYLAHVREVETSDKETWSLLKDGKFSVVICNRFPETEAASGGAKDWGNVNTVCLVSLEGWWDYLNNPDSLDAGGLSPAGARLLAFHLPGKERLQEPDVRPQGSMPPQPAAAESRRQTGPEGVMRRATRLHQPGLDDGLRPRQPRPAQ